MKINTHFTPTEACILIAHEAVSMLEAVETAVPQCLKEFRTALETISTVHDLGKDGETLLAWMDTEIANAERFVNEGINLPGMIDIYRLDIEPDAAAQMDFGWLLFDTAAMEECGPEQRQALVNTAQTITEMCGLGDLLLTTPQPNVVRLAAGLRAELADIQDSLPGGKELLARTDREPSPPTEPAM